MNEIPTSPGCMLCGYTERDVSHRVNDSTSLSHFHLPLAGLRLPPVADEDDWPGDTPPSPPNNHVRSPSNESSPCDGEETMPSLTTLRMEVESLGLLPGPRELTSSA